MYSTSAGTGSDSASTGTQIRAAMRVPSRIGIQTFSTSRTSRSFRSAATHHLALGAIAAAVLGACKALRAHDRVALQGRRVLARGYAAAERLGHCSQLVRSAPATHANEPSARLGGGHREVSHFVPSELKRLELDRESVPTTLVAQGHERRARARGPIRDRQRGDVARAIDSLDHALE